MRCATLLCLCLGAAPALGQQPATGRITGKVVGPLRAPVPAAQVWAEDAEGARIARTTTDGSGFFVLAGLAWGHIGVRATIPGGNVGFDFLDLSPAAPEQSVRLRIGDAARLQGTVVDGAGKPVPGAHLISENDLSFDWYIPEVTQRAVADAAGRFELDHVLLGPTTVRAWAPGHGLAEQRLHVTGDATLDCRLIKGEGASLRIRLQGASPEQIAAAKVTVVFVDQGRGRNLPPPLQHPVLDAAGSCLLNGLPPRFGIHMLRIGVPGAAVAPDQLRLESAEQEKQLDRTVELRVVPQAEEQVHGRLVDGNGRPLANQQVVCNGSWVSASIQATTDEDGRFALSSRLPVDAPITLQLASSALVLDAEGDRRYRGAFEGRVKPEHDFTLTAIPVARVTGRLVDARGNSMARVRVQLRRGDSEFACRSARTDPHGGFAFERLNGRDLETFRVRVEEEAGFVDGGPFQLADGTTRELAPLVLGASASISGVVHGADQKPLPGARVVVRRCHADTGIPSDGSMIEMITDRQGRFRFVGLEPRAWRLYHFEAGRADEETDGPWFELRPGVDENTVLKPK